MAGMAWTLHPALFYDKYGPVLVQLWESGAFSTLFRPVRRLSRTIGDALTSGLASRPQAGTDVELGEAEASELHLTDTSVATDDEAWTRVNRAPGDTSPEPSTSQQNELAFQGDLYTQMRRNRRQQERIEKIRESRRKFLEGSHSSASSKKWRTTASILISKKDKGLRRKAGGIGTPLADMEGVPQPRGVVIDTGGSSDSGESSDTDGTSGAAAKRGGPMLAQELRADNDSLKAFRAIRGRRKKGGVSPPPNFRRQSDTQTETGSISSEKPDEVLSPSSPSTAPDLMTPTGPQPKHSALKTGKGSKPQIQLGQKEGSVATILLSGKEAKEKTLELPDEEQVRKRGSRSPTVASVDVRTSTGKGSLPRGVSVTTTLQSKEERQQSSEESLSIPSPPGAAAKKEKAKRKKKKARSHKKKGKHKSKEAHGKGEEPGVVPGGSYKAGEQKPGAGAESQEPSQDATTSSVSPAQPAVASKETPEARATAFAKPSHEGVPKAGTSEVIASRKGPMPKPGSAKQDTLKVAKVQSPVLESPVSKEAGPVSPAEAPQAEKIASTSGLAASSPPSTKRHKKHSKRRKHKSTAAADGTSPRPTAPPDDVAPGEVEAQLPRPLPSEITEKTIDEAAATYRIRSGRLGRKKHHKGSKRTHKKMEALPPELGPQAAIGQTRPETQVDEPAGEKQCAVQPQGTTEVEAASRAQQGGATAAEVAGVSTSSASSIRRLLNLPSTDVTASEASTTRNMTTERRPGNVTVVEGNDVTIRLDLASQNKKFMFWPFRRKDKKKK